MLQRDGRITLPRWILPILMQQGDTPFVVLIFDARRIELLDLDVGRKFPPSLRVEW